MKRLARTLLACLICSAPLLAENWAGFAIIAQWFMMLFAILPMPFILFYAWLIATGNPSGLKFTTLVIGGIVVLAPVICMGIMGFPLLLWDAAWFGIGFATFRATKTRPVLIGAGLTFASAICAYVLVYWLLFGHPMHR